jgi:transcription initiation factor TFIID subunit 12
VDVIDIKNLTTRISSKDNLDSQVEKILALMADEFIRNTAEFACKLAKHRDSDTLEKDDVKFAIEKLYNINVPTKPSAVDRSGLTAQQISFPNSSTANYKQSLALVRKAHE